MVAVGKSLFVFGGCSAAGRLADLYEGVPDVAKGERLSCFECGTCIVEAPKGDNTGVFTIRGKRINVIYFFERRLNALM